MTALLEFAISTEYKFEAATGRFRYISGAAKGKFAPREAVLNLTRATVEAQSRELVALGDRLSSGKVTLKEFQVEAATLLRQIHISSAVLGKGGSDRMTSKDWLAVGRTLKIQYTDGYDKESNRRFGLKWLSEEIKSGAVSPAQLRNRLDLYAQSGMLSYYAAEKQTQVDKGLKEGKRILADTDLVCPECFAYGGLGWVPLSKLIMPTQKCSCKNRCRCRLVYR